MRSEAFVSSKPTVLILDSLAGVGISVQVIQCLAAGGAFDIAVASPHRGSILRHSRWVKRFHFLRSGLQPEEALDELKGVLKGGWADVLLPVNVDQIDLLIGHGAAGLAALAKLPLQPDPLAFRTACSKTLLSSFMEDNGIPHPRTVRFTAGDAAVRARLESLRLPVITKPTWGGGGSGMRVFESREGLLEHLEASSTPENPVVVQEFIRGFDLGSAVFCRDGEVLHMTMQRNVSADQGTFRPSKGLRFFDDPEVRGVVGRLMGALKWSGIAQVDLRQEEGSGALHVLEINPRYWGSVLGSARMGVNFPDIACRMAAGLPPCGGAYLPGKYITAMGYLLELRAKLQGRPNQETFEYAESAFPEMIADPMPRLVEVIQKLTRRTP